MNEINETTCFSIHPDVVYTLIDDEAVIMGIMDDKLYGMNHVGTEILKYLESNKTASVQSLAHYLSGQFEIKSTECMVDVQTFIQSMLSENLIIKVD